jgi:hypothetical protein
MDSNEVSTFSSNNMSYYSVRDELQAKRARHLNPEDALMVPVGARLVYKVTRLTRSCGTRCLRHQHMAMELEQPRLRHQHMAVGLCLQDQHVAVKLFARSAMFTKLNVAVELWTHSSSCWMALCCRS